MLEDIYNVRVVDERLSTSGQPSEEQLAEISEGRPRAAGFALMDDVWEPNEVWASFIVAQLPG